MNNNRLKLQKPIVFFDTETTGTSTETDRIVDIACIKILPSGVRQEFKARVNPGRPIPKEATEVHGITDEMVKDCPPFTEIASDLAEFFKDCDVAGYNVKRFDLPLLIQEFDRAKLDPIDCTTTNIVDCCKLYFIKEPRDLSAAAKYYAGIEEFDAHNAMADVEATISVMEGMLAKYDDIGTTPEEINAFINEQDRTVDLSVKFKRDNNGTICYNFGKNFGKPVASDLDYLKWMMEKTTMPKDSMKIAKKIMQDVAQQKIIKTWFDSTDLGGDLLSDHSFYLAISSRTSMYGVQIKIKDQFTHVIYEKLEETPLVLRCEDDENYLLHLVDSCYKEEGGISMAKAYYDHMDHD